VVYIVFCLKNGGRGLVLVRFEGFSVLETAVWEALASDDFRVK
jgi:hypothetical protein